MFKIIFKELSRDSVKDFPIKSLIFIIIMFSIIYIFGDEGKEKTNKNLEYLSARNRAAIIEKEEQKAIENKNNLIKEYQYLKTHYSPEYETRYNELAAWVNRENVFNLDYYDAYHSSSFSKNNSGNRQYLMEQKIDSMQREIDHLKYNSGR